MKSFTETLKRVIKRIPVVRSLAGRMYTAWAARKFRDSGDYWAERYRRGGNSGYGSYSDLARFKAEILNRFVAEHGIRSVIEYGCGDGNQLALAAYPAYTGFDISADAITRCRENYADDSTKRFLLIDEYHGETAELTLSLDVVYHLTEDNVFASYMERLFASAGRFVIIYSSNREQQDAIQGPHIRHRLFAAWAAANTPDWHLIRHIPNRFPFRPEDGTGSFADFYIYAKDTE